VAGLNYEIKLLDLLDEELDEIIEWAMENCPSFRAVFYRETDFVHDDLDPFEFIFENEKDATLFGLKFGSH